MPSRLLSARLRQQQVQPRRRPLPALIMLYDRDIREPLFDFLEERYGKIRIIEEKQMGKSRADIVMVLPDALPALR